MSRKTRGTALPVDSIASVRDVLASKGWTQDVWALNAHVCASTIGRLLRGKRLDAGTLKAALTALDLEISDLVIVHQNDHFAPTVSVPSSQQPGIYMTATFHQTERPQIERILRHLTSLLIGASVKFFDSGDGVRVSGNFEEHQRKEIEVALDDLESLCITFHPTW